MRSGHLDVFDAPVHRGSRRNFAKMFSRPWENHRMIVLPRMRAMNHWSARKQRIHLQSAAWISRHSALSEDRSLAARTQIASRHFLLQAPQCPCSVPKRFSRDHCCRGRSKPGYCVGSHTMTTWADFQLCLHRLLMSAGCKSSHSVFLDVSRRNGGLRISGWIG